MDQILRTGELRGGDPTTWTTCATLANRKNGGKNTFTAATEAATTGGWTDEGTTVVRSLKLQKRSIDLEWWQQLIECPMSHMGQDFMGVGSCWQA